MHTPNELATLTQQQPTSLVQERSTSEHTSPHMTRQICEGHRTSQMQFQQTTRPNAHKTHTPLSQTLAYRSICV